MISDNNSADKICVALAILILILIILHFSKNVCGKSTDNFTIREQNRPGSSWGPEVYQDPVSGLTIDDAYGALVGKVPATRVIMYHRLNCSEFAPMARVFRSVRPRLESPQIRFYEEVADPLNALDYESYPLVIKIWKNGITQESEIAKYEGSFDFGEFQDWVLNDKIETMPKLWFRTLSGEIAIQNQDKLSDHGCSREGTISQTFNYTDACKCQAKGGNGECTKGCSGLTSNYLTKYPTTRLDPSGRVHNHM